MLQKLVEKATDLHAKPDLKESDVAAWRTTARDFLVRTFGSQSPNVNAVLRASGDDCPDGHWTLRIRKLAEVRPYQQDQDS